MASGVLGVLRGACEHKRGVLHLGRWRAAVVGRCEAVRVPARLEARAAHKRNQPRTTSFCEFDR